MCLSAFVASCTCCPLAGHKTAQHAQHGTAEAATQCCPGCFSQHAGQKATSDAAMCSLLVCMQALGFYKRVQEWPDFNDASLWGKVANCQKALGDEEEMVSIYEAVMQDDRVCLLSMNHYKDGREDCHQPQCRHACVQQACCFLLVVCQATTAATIYKLHQIWLCQDGLPQQGGRHLACENCCPSSTSGRCSDARLKDQAALHLHSCTWNMVLHKRASMY